MTPARLLLDTHIALWLDSGDERLRAATRTRCEQVRHSGGTLLFSAVSAWEIAMLVECARIALDVPVEAWIERFVGRAGIEGLPLSLGAAAQAYARHPFPGRDPADRLLVATAIELGCPLLTYDRQMLEFGRRHGGQHRFQALS